MSQHVRARSRTSKRVAVAAALGLLAATAAWVNAPHDKPDGARGARALDDRGEKIDINGDGTPLRYMDKPSKDGGSKDAWYS
ncbi:hypothetical protein AB0F20_35590, partial [Streptomyces goshikiensis]|uniref:hypothetical protein n=1 Tax=Streptomyces goshikiensis TaxID=1942 RepID=UPI0033C02D88